MKKRKLWIILPACLLLLCAAVLGVYYASEGAGGMLSLFAKIDRTDMMFEAEFNGLPCRVYMPEDAVSAQKQYPLVLYLHGSGERGDDNRAQTRKNSVMQTLLNEENLHKYPCFILAPQCPEGRGWDAAQLMDLLEDFASNYPVDKARIYVTGLSMGGYAAWELLAAYPDYFAAAVPVCGGGDPETAPLFKDVPVWAFHGARDSAVPPEGSRDMIAALKAAGAPDVRYTEYPRERHQSWEKAWREPELFPWLFAQRKAEAPQSSPADMMQAKVFEGMPYRIYVPENLGNGAKVPLVLCLHGSGNRGDDNLAQLGMSSAVHTLLAPENRERYPCVVLAPQCPEGQRWVRGIGPYDLPGNTEWLTGLLEQVCAAYPVDRSRIYITGVSMGGFGTWGMLKACPDVFAAAVPISGGWNLADDTEHAPEMKDVPIWAFHGALDDDVPVERTRDMAEALEAVGGNIKYTEYPDGWHPIWDRVYAEPELFPWLFAQAKE
ncbi:MAG: prolyl oligopeptidase family serine peptidase [Firmicutes bacterium]|nr:prolyl oligopeptidase family serine peptidase [Bacillota bacterium]